ncbi:MAG TPA: GAF domain-containing protein [Acidimicrobiia bacterium]|nr:GAF domain-containing protein [Acidimicrobiia bacterium]
MTPEDAEGLARLSEILVFEQPLDGTAQDVIDLARDSLGQCDGVGIQVLDDGGIAARRTTDARSFDLDALQDELDDGPCVECLRDGERHDLEPVTSDERWPRFGPSARRVGLIACAALPLIAHGEHIGVLNLYAWPAVGFAGWDRPKCAMFAGRASQLLASARAYARTQVLIGELEARLAAIPAT